MEELQSFWEVPCIAQFISLFRHAFSLPQMDIEDLEETFIASEMPEGSDLLKSVIISLLKAFHGKKIRNWEVDLFKFLEKTWTKKEHKKNPLANGQSFHSLSLKSKVQIVYSLCVYRLDCWNVESIMKSMDADALRVQTLGTDSHGNVYWYIYGTRLYKEEPLKSFKKEKNWEDEWKQETSESPTLKKRGRGRPRKSDVPSGELSQHSIVSNRSFLDLDSQSRWSVVCDTFEDWEVFARKFKNSKYSNEVMMYKIITQNFLPELKGFYELKEKRMKEKLLELSADTPPSLLDSRQQLDETNDEDEVKYISAASEEDSPPLKKSRLSKSRKSVKAKLLHSGKSMCGDGAFGTKPLHLYDIDEQFLGDSFNGHPDIYLKLQEVLRRVKLHKHSWPFLKPVDEAIAPGYFDVVKDPIDLSAIERKILLKVYSSIKQIDQDFQKMVFNCRLYNGTSSEYTDMAETLLHVFRMGLCNQGKKEKSETKEKKGPNKSTPSHRAKISRLKNKSLIRSSRRKLRFKRKRTCLTKMEGLNMLAAASQQALKDVKNSETELYVCGNQPKSFKSESFPDLKIVPLHSHPYSLIEKFSASSNSSDSEENSTINSRPHVDRKGSESPSNEQHKHISPKRTIMNKFAQDKQDLLHSPQNTDDEVAQKLEPVSPDSCNNISCTLSPETDSTINDHLSENEGPPDITKNLSELDETLTVLGLSNESAKNDALSSLSSLFSRIIRENHELQMSDLSNLSYPEAMSDHISNEPSSQNLSLRNGDEDLSKSPMSLTLNQGASPDHNLSLLSSHTLGGMRPLTNLTTVDASVLGLATNNACSPCIPQNNLSLSNHSPTQPRSMDSSYSLTPETLVDREYMAKGNSQAMPIIVPYPSPPLTGSSDSAKGEERQYEIAPSKSKSCSPDSQNSRYSTSLGVSTPPHINSTQSISTSPTSTSSIQVVNSASPGASYISSSHSNDLSSPKHLLDPPPLLMPISNLTLPLLPFSSQVPDCHTTNSFITGSTTSSQAVLKPIASLAVNPVTSNSSVMSHISSGPQTLSSKTITSVSPSAKSTNAQKGKKRKRATVQHTNIAPAVSVPPMSSFSAQNQSSYVFNQAPLSRSLQAQVVSPDSSNMGNISNGVAYESLKSYRESNLACTPAPSSVTMFHPYNIASFNDNTKYTTMAENNSFWNIKDIRPAYSIPVSHSTNTFSLLPPVPQSALLSNGFSILNGENRLQTVYSSQTGMENSHSPQVSDKTISPVPNSSASTLFPSFPILYTVPTSSTDTVMQSVGKDCGAICSSTRTEGINLPLQQPSQIFHGIPPRPMQDVASQQLGHPSYLSVPHYMVPPQQSLPPILPAPLVPTLTISGEPYNRSDNVPSQLGGKISPVYTVLQNVPIKPHQ